MNCPQKRLQAALGIVAEVLDVAHAIDPQTLDVEDQEHDESHAEPRHVPPGWTRDTIPRVGVRLDAQGTSTTHRKAMAMSGTSQKTSPRRDVRTA